MNIVVLSAEPKYESQITEFSSLPDPAAPAANSESPGLDENGISSGNRGAAKEEVSGSSKSERKPQFQGFKSISYTQETADLEIALNIPAETPNGPSDLVVLPMRMLWHDGDWRTKEMQGETGMYEVASLFEFVMWNHCRLPKGRCPR